MAALHARLLLALLAPAAAAGQGLPAFAPVNPLAAGRTPLSFEPFHPAQAGHWGFSADLSYASTIESNSTSAAVYLLDSKRPAERAAVRRLNDALAKVRKA